MRLSRKVLTGLVGIGAIVVFGALIWALYQGNRRPGGGSELYNTENKTTPDGLCRRTWRKSSPPRAARRCRICATSGWSMC
jgi:type IV secretion system protein VirB10